MSVAGEKGRKLSILTLQGHAFFIKLPLHPSITHTEHNVCRQAANPSSLCGQFHPGHSLPCAPDRHASRNPVHLKCCNLFALVAASHGHPFSQGEGIPVGRGARQCHCSLPQSFFCLWVLVHLRRAHTLLGLLLERMVAFRPVLACLAR